MLNELSVSNLAVIKNIDLEFVSKDTALVGETGAGKSILINSLSLLLGQKADYSLLRDKNLPSKVTASFSLSDDYINRHPEVSKFLVDDNSLLLNRVISPDKSSRYHINGKLCSASEYKEVVSHLIDIHSQGANSDLFDEKKQLFYLDCFGGKEISKLKEDYLISLNAFKDKKKELEQLEKDAKEADRNYLEYQIEEIKKYHLKENEIEDLNQEFEAFRQNEKIRSKYEELVKLEETQPSDLSTTLSLMKSRLMTFEDTILKEKSQDLIEDINKFISDLRVFDEVYDSLDISLERIDSINSRLFELRSLQRKYGKTTQEILDKLAFYENSLSRIDEFERYQHDLKEEYEVLLSEATKKAQILSNVRKQVALKLSKEINAELAELGLLSGGFSISFNESNMNEDGIDDISFDVCLNKGMEPTMLKKAASGGEASRLMLALKVVLNSLDPYDVLVFDEVDTGVSGRIASLVALKIKKLSSSSQIIVISHLPQVVASCDSVYKIYKVSDDKETETKIKKCEGDEVYEEIARLISGKEVTPSALKQAEILRREYFDEQKDSSY